MVKRLPPLHTLHVFEVAGRHQSFSRAADELCLTNAAISHQIKLLEAHLGLKLFHRHNNQLELSNEGMDYLPRVREALRSLQQATDRLTRKVGAPLRVALPPSFGAKWLVPRLYRFFKLHPNMRVEIDTNFEQDLHHYDLCIDNRQASSPDLCVENFAGTTFFPVCSPELQADIRCPQDLRRQTLLHERGNRHFAHYPSWQQWLDEVDVSGVDALAGPAFSEALMTLQAAMDGQGVALGQEILVAYDLAAGRLVRPLQTTTSLRLSYYLIYPVEHSSQPGFALLRQWLLDEAAATRQPAPN